MRFPIHLLPLVLALPAYAQFFDEGPPRDHEITLEDYFSIAHVSQCALAPDGSAVAWPELRWEEPRDRRNTDLWVASIADGRRTRLTFDPAEDGSPQWSPDGRWIYFTSSRGDEDVPPANGKRQVWRVPVDGGQPAAVTRLEDGVQAFELSRDGRFVYYTTRDDRHEDDRWQALRKQFDKLEYGRGIPATDALHRLDLESWRDETLIEPNRVIRLFAVSPDQQRIALITAPDEELISYEGWSAVEIYDVASGSLTMLEDELWREQAPSPYGWIVTPAWADDSDALAFRVQFDGYPGEIFVAELGGDAGPRTSRVARPHEVHVEGGLAWRPGTRDLCFLADDRARSRVYVVHGVSGEQRGEAWPLTPRDVVVSGFSFSRDGSALAVVMPGMDHPPDLFMVQNPGPDAEYSRVTTLNPQVERWMVPQIEQVRWQAPDGLDVEGILELPHGYRREQPLPLVVHLHGGPTSATMRAFSFGMGGQTLFASRGWALFSPNYRGSTGFGDAFMTDLVGRENDIEVGDILSGIDWLIDQGVADPERIAVMGWSNGGYLTNCLITRTDRFKAASSGAGVFDMVMQWSLEDTPGHVINYMQGLPWEVAEHMHQASALYAANRITTPTLIHVGENDERVPAAHSRALFRALHRYLGVPTELIVYPDEGHGLSRYSHRKAKMSWDLAWFEHHVLGRNEEVESRK